MTSPSKPWETTLQSSSNVLSSVNQNPSLGRPLARNATTPGPALPPRPNNAPAPSYSPLSSPYSSYNSVGGYGGSYGSYGGLTSSPYSSYGLPYRSSLYGSYGGGYGTGGYGSGMYGMNGGYPGGGPYQPNDAETRFIQYAEQSSRKTFADVESIVRAFNSLAMMLDNTFFAMTSSFRAVLGVAENFGRLRSMFGHIWHSINVFRLAIWFYRKCMNLLGVNGGRSDTSAAWRQAATVGGPSAGAGGGGGGQSGGGSNWPTLAFLGVLVSAPYFISRFFLKYEDKSDPVNWKNPGVRARAVFDFVATAPNELSIQLNDDIRLAPTYIQEEMGLKNTGWAFAVCNGRSGVVPLNYLVLNKQPYSMTNAGPDILVPRNGHPPAKTHTKRVSFGENQIFENVDLEDYVTGKKPIFDKSNEKRVFRAPKYTDNVNSTSKSPKAETVYVNNEDNNTPSCSTPSTSSSAESGVKSAAEVAKDCSQTEVATIKGSDSSTAVP